MYHIYRINSKSIQEPMFIESEKELMKNLPDGLLLYLNTEHDQYEISLKYNDTIFVLIQKCAHTENYVDLSDMYNEFLYKFFNTMMNPKFTLKTWKELQSKLTYKHNNGKDIVDAIRALRKDQELTKSAIDYTFSKGKEQYDEIVRCVKENFLEEVHCKKEEFKDYDDIEYLGISENHVHVVINPDTKVSGDYLLLMQIARLIKTNNKFKQDMLNIVNDYHDSLEFINNGV